LTELEKDAVTEFSSEVKHALAKNLFSLRLFGPKATGKFDVESGIDILIIVHNRNEPTLDLIIEILLDVELKHDCVISPVVLSVNEYLANEKHRTLLYQEIERDGLPL